MADEIGTVRVELIADPSGIKRGIEEAGGALQRFAAVGTAVGNLLAQAFTEIASRMTEMIQGLIDGTSELFQHLDNNSRQAVRLIGRSFAEIGERATEFQATLLARVLPGIAAVVEKFTQLSDQSGITAAAIEVLVAALKSLLSAGAIVMAVFEALGKVVATVASAVMQVARGEFAQAWETIKAGTIDVGRVTAQTGQLIQDVWRETAIAAARAGVAGKAGSEEAAREAEQAIRDRERATREAVSEAQRGWDEWRRTREQALRDTMMDVTSDPTATLQDRIAAIKAAYEEGAIAAGRFNKAMRDAEIANAKAMESALSTVGHALTAVFAKSKPAAIAAALINTYVGITQALRSLPPPWSFIQAAAVGAMGFAQVRNITSTSSSGGGAPASVAAPSDGGASAGPTQTLMVQGIDPNSIMSGMSVRDLAERLIAYQRDGGQVVIQ